MKHIFRAYDVRGIWGKDLDPEIGLSIGRGLGAFLKEDLGMKEVALGYDVRTTSTSFNNVIEAGLLSSGIDIRSVGRTGFGVAMFAGSDMGCDASCFITASHLEPEWNGIKTYFGNGIGFPEEHIMSIRDRVLEKRFVDYDWKKMGNVTRHDYLQNYIDFWRGEYLESLSSSNIKMGMDCGGGAMTLSAPFVFKDTSIQTELVHGEPDPFFSGRPSEPKPKNLGKLKDAILDHGLDFGVAFDGDGDRAVVIDDQGNFLSTDRLGILIATSLVKRDNGGMVLANVESSMAMEDVLVPLGARVKRIKVGHTFLTLEAKEENAVFGVERSGHLIVPEHVLFDDALVAPLEVIRILDHEKRRLSELAEEVPQYHSDSHAFECSDDTKFDVVASLVGDMKGSYDRVNTMDGVRVDMDEGWVLIRCSNTSPVIRLTAEARNEMDLKRIEDDFGKILKEKINSFS